MDHHELSQLVDKACGGMYAQLATLYRMSKDMSAAGRAMSQTGYGMELGRIFSSTNGMHVPENHMGLHMLYEQHYPQALRRV
jgi:hypothetical protein